MKVKLQFRHFFARVQDGRITPDAYITYTDTWAGERYRRLWIDLYFFKVFIAIDEVDPK